MRRALSVADIKRHRLPRLAAESVSPAVAALQPASFALSRRQALGLAGALSVTAAPIASAIESALSSTYTMHRRGDRVAFSVAGIERWVVDPRAFDGEPSLKVTEDASGIVLALTGAYFPGTNVPADIVARISRGTTSQVTFEFPRLSARCTADFVRWLLDRDTATSPLDQDLHWNVGDGVTNLHAEAVSYRPSWTLHVKGAGTTRIDGKTLGSTRLDIGLLTSDHPTMLVPSPKKRSLTRLHRGTSPWEVSLRHANTDDWNVLAADDAFETCSIESTSDARTAVVFEGSADGRVTLTPAAYDVRLGLREVRYAFVNAEAGRHEVLVARYSERPTWMIAHGVSLELGDRANIPPLEIEARNGQIVRCVVAPALLRYTIPVNGAVTEPTRTHPLAQLALIPTNLPASALPSPHQHMSALSLTPTSSFHIASYQQGMQPSVNTKIKAKPKPMMPGKMKSNLTLAGNPTVTVIRPDDLLVLTFEFAGLSINKAGGTFSSGGNGKLIVHFQPQHIAERAFFYVNDKDKPANDPSLPDSAPKNTGSNEPLLEPPIDAVLAHPSRLVFTVPNGHSGQYSIEGLLDWSKFTQRVSPSAKPPDPEYVYWKLGSSQISKFSGVMAPKDTKGVTVAQKRGAFTPSASKGTKYSMNSQVAAKLPATSKSATTDLFENSSDIANAIKGPMISDYAAAINAKPPIRTPLDEETVIEYPYRLMLSPNKYAGWAHSRTAKTNEATGQTELWHTRLGVKHSDGTVDENAAYFRTVRAIWSPDFGTFYLMDAKYKERPFRTSLNRRDRHEIVRLTSDYGMQTKDEPVDVKRLMLTSLGAWADMTGAWDPLSEDELDVEQWIQRGTQGRDHFVRVCYKGYLFPFGNRATLVKETERKFKRTPRGEMAAYLMQRMYIILREPVRDYPANGLQGMQYQGRDFPFRRVTITTKTTPNLRQPSLTQLSGMSSNSFWPQFELDSGSPSDVLWTCIGRDWDNNDVQFSAPLAFIANTDAGGGNCESWIKNGYPGQTSRRTLDMAGQPIAFAPSTKKGDTTLPTSTFMLSGYYSSTVPANTPRFFPSMQKSKVSIEQVNELVGTDAPKEIEYFLPYLKYAFEKGVPAAKGAATVNLDQVKNTAQIFVNLLDKLDMDFGAQSDKAGGLAAPSIGIGALSRLLGPIPGDFKLPGGLADEAAKMAAMADKVKNAVVAAGNFDPMQYFENLLNTKILGDITLKDVLDFLQDVLNNADKMPGLGKKDDFGVTDTIKEVASKSEVASELTDKLNANELVKQAAKELDPYLSEINSEVKEAKEKLEAEINAVKAEIEQAKQDVMNELAGAKKALDNKLREWKKRVEDVANELKSEIEKAIQPLKEAGNEIYKKYEQASDALESLKKGLNLVYEWSTEIKNSPGDLLTPIEGKKAVLYLKAEMKKKLDLQPPEILLYGSLSNFVVNLIGTGAAQMIIIKFNRLALSAKVGEKPSIDPDIETVEFAGPLTFVNKLKDLIPSGGSGGGGGGVGFSFGFDVTPKGITASMTITLPNVTVGVFSLMNMSFLMSVTVPFDGRPFSAYFAFCTRENPFRLTVMMFGGGGFFGIEITPAGVRMMEAAFEFGGNFAFDCGVASGGASVMAGVYYKMEQKEFDDPDNPGSTITKPYSELTGYFRLTGNLSILGIIRINLLFELKLTWQSNGKVFGTATIEVEIEILFISFSVGVTVERQLKGSDGDPTFKDMLPQPSMWADYCNAFA